MKVQLRDYQAAAFDLAREAVKAGKRRILIVAPTGGGKTILASALMEMTMQKGRRANFVIDRLSLLTQTSETFDRYGIDHGVIQSMHPRYRPSLPVQICSVQTIQKRGWPESQLDVFDEAHTLHAAHKQRIESKAAITIGLTATPFTKGLGKYFDAVINVTTTRKLINDGWLVPYRAFSCAEPDMTGVKVKSTGEWEEEGASKAALQVVGDVVAEYLKNGEGRKFICSAVDTAHVDELARQFQASGVNVATFTYKDSSEDREDTLSEFRKPSSSIRGLITVTAASKGMDCPDIGCVIMARPLRKSLAEHIQLMGRGLRISPETGKKDCVILDHSANFARFFGATEEFFDNGISELDDGKPKDKKKEKEKPEVEPIKCPSCRVVHKPAPFCPNCGHAYPARKSVQHVPGTLKELVAARESKRLDKDIFPQIAAYAMSRKDGDAARRMAQAIYKTMTGEFAMVRWESVVPVSPTPEVIKAIRAQQIRMAKQREAAERGMERGMARRLMNAI